MLCLLQELEALSQLRHLGSLLQAAGTLQALSGTGFLGVSTWIHSESGLTKFHNLPRVTGKSTVLDILALRKSTGMLKGQVCSDSLRLFLGLYSQKMSQRCSFDCRLIFTMHLSNALPAVSHLPEVANRARLLGKAASSARHTAG